MRDTGSLIINEIYAISLLFKMVYRDFTLFQAKPSKMTNKLLLSFASFFILSHVSLFAQEDEYAKAESFLNKADSLNEVGQYDRASLYIDSVSVMMDLQSHSDQDSLRTSLFIRSILAKAILFKDKTQYPEALALLTEASQLTDSLLGKRHLLYAKLLMERGNIANQKDQSNISLPLYLEAYDIFKEVLGDKDEQIGKIMANIGDAYRRNAQYQKSLEYLVPAMDIMEQNYGKRSPEMAMIYNNLGSTYNRLGDYDLVLFYDELARDIYVENYGEEHMRVAAMDNNIGLLHFHKNDFEKALDYYFRALKVLKQQFGEEHFYVAIICSNLGVTYEGLEDYENAIAYQEKALKIKESTVGKESISYASSISYLANVYRRQGKYQLALDQYQHAFGIISKDVGKKHPLISRTYNELSKVYLGMETYDQAKEMSIKALNAVITDSISSDRMIDWLHSESSGDEWVIKFDEIIHTFEVLDGLKGAALASYLSEDHQEAYLFQLGAIDLIDYMHSGFKQEGSKLFLQDYVLPVYAQTIETAHTLAQTPQANRQDQKQAEGPKIKEDAFRLSEKTKGIILGQGIRASKTTQLANISQAVKERDQYLRSALGYYRTSVYEERNKATPDSVKLFEEREILFGLEQSYDSLLAELKANYPSYYELRYETEPPSLSEIQSYLKGQHTAMASYFWGDEHLFAFLISEDQFLIHTAPMDSNFKAEIRHFRSFIEHLDSTDVQQYQKLAFSLSQKLGLFQDIMDAEDWIIIPDGPLSFIPFEALLSKESSANSFNELPYWVLKKTIRYEYAAALAINERAPTDQQKWFQQPNYVGFAPSYTGPNANLMATRSPIVDAVDRDWELPQLMFTETEVTEAAAITGGDYYVGAKATEDAFKSLNAPTHILHLAMHGFTHDEVPEYSGLVFFNPSEETINTATKEEQSFEEKQDGYLHAYEIYNMSIQAELAILSACQTGIGKILRGEGMMSLARAFKYAGCNNIITSLWQANDQSTHQLIRQFLHELKDHQPKANALRTAKIQYLQDADPLESHPALWSTFILIGDNEPSYPNRSFIFYVGAILIFTILLFMIGRIFRTFTNRREV